MTSLKKILDGLEDEDRRRLMYAFENSLSQYVELTGGKFIGVNVSTPNLEKEVEAGVWSTGTIIKRKQIR